MVKEKRNRSVKTDKLNRILPTGLAAAILLSSAGALADESGLRAAPLKPDVPYVFVVHNGRSIKIQRNIEKSFRAGLDIRGELMQSSDACPPFCIQPIYLDVPVDTVGETEIVDFMLTALREGRGTLVDVRSPKSYNTSTIPGSVSLFIQDLKKAKDNDEMGRIFERFGAKRRETPNWLVQQLEGYGLIGNGLRTADWDFSEAKELVVWSTGATEPSSARVVRMLLEAGYPASKLKWYRGGMASWQYWGFTTVRKPKRR